MSLGLEFLDGQSTSKKGSDWPKERPGDKLPACVDTVELELAPRFFSPSGKDGEPQTCGLGWYGSGKGTIGGRECRVQITVQVDGVRLTREQVMAYIARATEAKHAGK